MTITPIQDENNSETDDDERLELTQDVVRYHRNQASALFLYDQIAFDALAPRVKNYDTRTILISYDDIDVAE